ncbi:stage III sporulation protein SpoIIIAB [Paenibacillus sp. MBLB4367]|uniref:stage III sporulation protein SpoIIIAB n=1 Tax=Paenibacillus sp. MBLB4367 TaxID=3384767 RepID=UPI00390830B8
MFKLIGAACILFAGTMLGFYQAGLFARRPKQIRQLVQALKRLETEIGYGFMPLPDALGTAAKPLSAPLAAMFTKAASRMRDPDGRPAADSWKEAIAEGWPFTAMKAGELEVMQQLGSTLGVSDREDQIKHLRLAVSHLQAEEETAREEQKRYETMWKSLGVLTGALVVILMY